MAEGEHVMNISDENRKTDESVKDTMKKDTAQRDIEQLIETAHANRACAPIDLRAMEENMDTMHAHCGDAVKMLGVIKTNGYGHGAIPIAEILEKKDYMWGYATATFEEAVELRNAGIKKGILILGYTFPYCYEDLIRMEIRMAVFRKDQLEQLNACAKKLQKKALIHVAVDTGMSRIGIRPGAEGEAFLQQAYSMEWITVEGIFTHFAKADEMDKTFAKKQYQEFTEFVDGFEKKYRCRIPIHHCSNSAGIVELDTMRLDMVRAGITLYGLWPSDEVRQDIIPLKPVMSLISHIVYVKEIDARTPISYGGTFVSSRKMKIATIPVGYGDGYPRSLSNRGMVLIHGKKAPIVGRVCMDQFMVDVSEIEEVAEGDQVVLIGKQGEEQITMEMLGDLSGRFNYELACDISARVKRVYIY